MRTRMKWLKDLTRWTAATLVVAALTALALPTRETNAASGPLSLKSPQDIKFYSYNGVTEMYIVDTGNNRVIRANMDGKADLIVDVNNPTAVAVDGEGNLYVAESGLAAGLHAFDRDGEPLSMLKHNGETMVNPIDLISRMVTNPVPNYPKVMNIKSLVVLTKINPVTQQAYKEAKFQFENYAVIGSFPTVVGMLNRSSTLKLDLSGSSGGGSSNAGNGEWGLAIHFDGRVWESQGYVVDLEGVFNMFPEAGYSTGEIAVDFLGEKFYVVVNETKIFRASYVGASYTNRPTLQPWLNLTDDYEISKPHAISVGPDNKLYVTDAAQDRVIVLNLDDTGTFNRVLSLTYKPKNPPFAGSFVKRGNQGKALALNGSDFLNGYSDPKGSAMQEISIVKLPDHGTLSLSGVPVQDGQSIPLASLNGLAFTPDASWSGTTFFEWQAMNSAGAYSETAGKVEIIIRPKGDANGDGVVTPADALLITKYLKGKITLTADQLEALDMDEDGEITEADAALIMNIYMGNAG